MNDRIVLGAYDEAVRHSPMKSGKTGPARPQQIVRGVLHSPNATGTVSFGQGMAISFAGHERGLVVNRADYPEISFEIGDKVRAMDRPGQPAFTVVRVSNGFPTIIVVHLGA